MVPSPPSATIACVSAGSIRAAVPISAMATPRSAPQFRRCPISTVHAWSGVRTTPTGGPPVTSRLKGARCAVTGAPRPEWQVLRSTGAEEEGGDDRAGLRRGLVDGGVGAVEQVPAVDERRGAATVEVDRVTSTEGHEQPGELVEEQAGVHARAPPVAADREQLAVAHAERAARVALGGDVGVELPGAGREALVVARLHGAPVANEQRPGAHQVAD